MHLVVCVDERDGLSFAGRRLSSDCILTDYILSLSAHSRVWIAPYSEKLFAGNNICISVDYFNKCQPGEYCFLEKEISHISKDILESVTLCKWNRRYPATEFFHRELLTGMRLISTEDFPGNSHDRITVERYLP